MKRTLKDGKTIRKDTEPKGWTTECGEEGKMENVRRKTLEQRLAMEEWDVLELFSKTISESKKSEIVLGDGYRRGQKLALAHLTTGDIESLKEWGRVVEAVFMKDAETILLLPSLTQYRHSMDQEIVELYRDVHLMVGECRDGEDTKWLRRWLVAVLGYANREELCVLSDDVVWR